MRAVKKFFIFALCGIMSLASFTACVGGGEGGETSGKHDNSIPTQIIDKNKKQIAFSVFNGGYGYEWAVRKANEWNATNEKYEVIVAPNKDEWYTFQANLEAGTCRYDIMQNAPSASDYVLGYLENLTDVINSPAQGENVTLYEKTKDQSRLEAVYSYNGEYFSIPFIDSVNGFVYDHEIFKEKCFLIGTNGKLISSPNAELSVGRDGKAGTYDDGQPTNMTEYKLMVDAIKNSGIYTYLWTGKFSYYTEPLFWQLFYDYAGRENVNNIFRGLDGSYTNPKTGETTNISVDNGYEVYEMAGYYEALKFIDDYLADPTYYHPSAAKYSTSHTDAQKIFVYGNAFDGATADKQVAFLYEGNWWENEARANFNSLAGRGYTDYEFGTRDYRMMLPPALDEKGEYESIPHVTFSTLSICVKKQSDPEKLAAIKDFLSYFYKNEVLNDIAVSSGGLIPFNTNMTETEYSKMTKFTANVQKMYNDPNSFLVNLNAYEVEMNGSAERKKFVVSADNTGNNTTQYPIDFFLRGSGITTKGNATDIYNATREYVRTNWGSWK